MYGLAAQLEDVNNWNARLTLTKSLSTLKNLKYISNFCDTSAPLGTDSLKVLSLVSKGGKKALPTP